MSLFAAKWLALRKWREYVKEDRLWMRALRAFCGKTPELQNVARLSHLVSEAQSCLEEELLRTTRLSKQEFDTSLEHAKENASANPKDRVSAS